LAGCSNGDRAAGTANNGTNANTEVKTVKIAYLPITHALPLYVEMNLQMKTLKILNWSL